MVTFFSSHDTVQVEEAVQIVVSKLLHNNVLAIPTDTIYGLAGIFKEEVARRIHLMKERDVTKPFILAVSETTNYQQFIEKKKLLCNWEKVVKEVWPGKTTLIFPKKESVFYPSGDTIALRMPSQDDNVFFYKVLQKVGELLVPSLNKAGKEPLSDEQSIKKEFGEQIDGIYIDRDFFAKKPSQIIDLTRETPVILRS